MYTKFTFDIYVIYFLFFHTVFEIKMKITNKTVAKSKQCFYLQLPSTFKQNVGDKNGIKRPIKQRKCKTYNVM